MYVCGIYLYVFISDISWWCQKRRYLQPCVCCYWLSKVSATICTHIHAHTYIYTHTFIYFSKATDNSTNSGLRSWQKDRQQPSSKAEPSCWCATAVRRGDTPSQSAVISERRVYQTKLSGDGNNFLLFFVFFLYKFFSFRSNKSSNQRWVERKTRMCVRKRWLRNTRRAENSYRSIVETSIALFAHIIHKAKFVRLVFNLLTFHNSPDYFVANTRCLFMFLLLFLLCCQSAGARV